MKLNKVVKKYAFLHWLFLTLFCGVTITSCRNSRENQIASSSTSENDLEKEFKIFEKAAGAKNNFVYSPLSILSGVSSAEVLAGQRPTRSPMAEIESLRTSSSKDYIKLTNAFFSKEKPNQTVLTELQKSVDSSFELNPAAPTMAGINQWVSRMTNGLIPSILANEPGSLTTVNALSFGSKWLEKDKFFEAEMKFNGFTVPGFTNDQAARSGTQESVTGIKGEYSKPVDCSCAIVTLPMLGLFEMSFIKLLNYSDNAFYELGKKVTSDNFLSSNAEESLFEKLWIPKVTISPSGSVDVSSLSKSSAAVQLFHSAAIRFDQNGADVAAATVGTTRGGGPTKVEEKIEFNTPFYAVVRFRSESIIAIARVMQVKP